MTASSRAPMRVTMLNKYYPPHLGGIEYHMRDLATELASRGHEVRAIVANEGREQLTETVDGVEVTRLERSFAYASTPVAPAMRNTIAAAAGSTDVFHLHFPYPWGEMAWLGAGVGGRARGGVATVLTYHSDIVRQKVLGRLYEPMLRRMLDRVDLVIASSPNMVEHSPELSRIAEKCRVVPFGIHVERFAATPERVARAAELRASIAGPPSADAGSLRASAAGSPHAIAGPSIPTRPVILFVGRLIYYKGAEVLVRAMASVDAELVMIGNGPLREDLELLAARLGIAERVHFIEPVGDDDLAAWYHAADVFCLPSVARSEAFGLVQLEAHAAGTPVVSTTLTTGVPFVNENGVTGLTVPPGDAGVLAGALGALVADEALRARLGGQAARRAQEEFTISRMVERTLAVYDEARGVV